MTIPQAGYRDKYEDEWKNHPAGCLCAHCLVWGYRAEDDEESGRYLAQRHRPRQCDFDGDHR